jgi:hypothetical protein
MREFTQIREVQCFQCQRWVTQAACSKDGTCVCYDSLRLLGVKLEVG